MLLHVLVHAQQLKSALAGGILRNIRQDSGLCVRESEWAHLVTFCTKGLLLCSFQFQCASLVYVAARYIPGERSFFGKEEQCGTSKRDRANKIKPCRSRACTWVVLRNKPGNRASASLENKQCRIMILLRQLSRSFSVGDPGVLVFNEFQDPRLQLQGRKGPI